MKSLLLLFLLIPGLANADVSVPRAKQYLWSVYDVSDSGGASTSHALGVSLPAGAQVTNAWVYINTVFAASGTESLGLSCNGSQDLVAYQPFKNIAVNTLFGGQATASLNAGSAVVGPLAYLGGTAQVGFGSTPAACSLVANVRGDSGYTPYSAGKATFIIEYFRQ